MTKFVVTFSISNFTDYCVEDSGCLGQFETLEKAKNSVIAHIDENYEVDCIEANTDNFVEVNYDDIIAVYMITEVTI